MIEPLKVGRHIGPYGDGDIMADLTKGGGVNIWINYDNAGHKPTISMTPEEWDRLMTWVEWQRKDKAINKGES